MKFSIFSWKDQRVSQIILNLILLFYIIFKLGTIFFYRRENFFAKINARIDSPSYVIRNHYRDYLEFWADNNAEIKEIINVKENELESTLLERKSIYKTFLNMQFLSEQLKIKEKKSIYSKFGEWAFLKCDYCKTDTDFIMFLAPSAIFEYSLFLILVGALSSYSSKSNWRLYGLVLAFLSFVFELYAFIFPLHSMTTFEPYDFIFGDDMLTLRYEKITTIREIFFLSFLIISLIFDNGKDQKLISVLDHSRNLLETSLSFLQAARIQSAAISIDENLQKHVLEVNKSNKSKLSSIISDPGFRQKVADEGHKLNIDELMEQKSKNIDELIKLMHKQ